MKKLKNFIAGHKAAVILLSVLLAAAAAFQGVCRLTVLTPKISASEITGAYTVALGEDGEFHNTPIDRAYYSDIADIINGEPRNLLFRLFPVGQYYPPMDKQAHCGEILVELSNNRQYKLMQIYVNVYRKDMAMGVLYSGGGTTKSWWMPESASYQKFYDLYTGILRGAGQ